MGFGLRREVEKIYRCHCTLCRKQGSTGSNFATIVHRDTFEWTRGEHDISRYSRATGFSSHFCAACGSTVPNTLRGSEFVWIPLGALDATVRVSTVAHLHVASAASWDQIPDAADIFERMPAVTELLALLGVDKAG